MHEVGMSMQCISGADAPSQRQLANQRLGERDLVGFLIDPDLQQGAAGREKEAWTKPGTQRRLVFPAPLGDCFTPIAVG